MPARTQDRAQVFDVDPKRVFSRVPIQVDWHDFLARVWQPGSVFSVGEVIRQKRANSAGYELECTQAGVSGSRTLVWPQDIGRSLSEGSVRWVSRNLTAESFRTTILTSAWTSDPPGLTLSDESISDFIYTVFVDDGHSGVTYDVVHSIILADGEEMQAVARLPVRD